MQRQILKLSGHKNILPKRKKVAAYVRVSSGKDAMMHSYCQLKLVTTVN